MIRNPKAGGIKAPPTIIVHKMPEPWGLSSPKPFNAKLKMVGNIMELNSPTEIIAHIAINPTDKFDIITNKIAQEAKTLNIMDGLNILVK